MHNHFYYLVTSFSGINKLSFYEKFLFDIADGVDYANAVDGAGYRVS